MGTDPTPIPLAAILSPNREGCKSHLDPILLFPIISTQARQALRISRRNIGRSRMYAMVYDSRVLASSGPGIRIPPPAIYAAALAIGLVLNYLWTMSPLSGFSRYVIGAGVISVNLLIMPSVLRGFRRVGTPFFDLRKPASALITEGHYRFSRNPSYVSLTLLYLGIGILLNNGWILILVAPVLLVMDLWVVRREERHLEAKFGEEYLRYKASVRRWL